MVAAAPAGTSNASGLPVPPATDAATLTPVPATVPSALLRPVAQPAEPERGPRSSAAEAPPTVRIGLIEVTVEAPAAAPPAPARESSLASRLYLRRL
jgi:hypothetical protein